METHILETNNNSFDDDAYVRFVIFEIYICNNEILKEYQGYYRIENSITIFIPNGIERIRKNDFLNPYVRIKRFSSAYYTNIRCYYKNLIQNFIRLFFIRCFNDSHTSKYMCVLSNCIKTQVAHKYTFNYTNIHSLVYYSI